MSPRTILPYFLLVPCMMLVASNRASAQLKIEYIAHSSFVIESAQGIRIVLDPYNSFRWLGYSFPRPPRVDAVLITHPHYDHDASYYFGPDTPVFRKPAKLEIGDVRLEGFSGKHADPYGKDFGQSNTIWIVETAGIRLGHLGDNGPLEPALLQQIGEDVLAGSLYQRVERHSARQDLIEKAQSFLEAEEIPFLPLFDGKSLRGWEQKNGEARYEVVDGAIVGTSVPDTPNSFLCTTKHYGDFILELEFKVDPGMNSGVQNRSHAYPSPTKISVRSSGGEIRERTVPAGRVHGYQVEIDPSDRAWTGGIYDEARRGWLNDLSENEAARKAFRPGEWNKFRIEAVKDRIRTWLNGVPAADLKDNMTASGFIALQVHGVGNHPERAGKQVRWRNLRIKDLSALSQR